MTKSFGWQDNKYKCCPTKHHLQARDIKLLQMQRREEYGLLTQRPTHWQGDLFCFFWLQYLFLQEMIWLGGTVLLRLSSDIVQVFVPL